MVLKLIGLLKAALPDCPEADIFWGYHFVTGALMLTLARTGRIDKLSGGVCRSDDFHAVKERMAAFMAAGSIEVERLTKKGRRRFDVRAAVSVCELDRRAAEAADAPCAILRMVVRHSTPAVRPDDILTGLRQVADLAPPSPPLVTRLAQGPLDAATGGLADPLDPDRETGLPSGDEAGTAGGARPRPGDPASADAVSA